jgi:hypothetical protein
MFKHIHDHMMAFRNEHLCQQVAEYTYDSFMIRARAADGRALSEVAAAAAGQNAEVLLQGGVSR